MPNGHQQLDFAYGGELSWYEPEAPHLGHAKHLCDMAKRGVDLNLYKELVKDAKFICKKCGRVAAKEENLCEPVQL